MKTKFLIFTLIFALISCESDEEIENPSISLKTAFSEQFISFDIDDRNIRLTEFNDNAWPFWGRLAPTQSMGFNTDSQQVISRSIYASIPKDQVLKNHIETFGLEFNQIFEKKDIDTSSNQLLNNKQFRTEFLILDEQNNELSNFGFAQTYIVASGEKNTSSIIINKIDNIIDKDNLILITGEFHGRVSGIGMGMSQYGFDLINGHFKVLIEN